MIDKLADRLAAAVVDQSIADKSQLELYRFAYQLLLETIITWGSILIVGGACGLFLPTVAYGVFYIPLRIYAGGYHARNFLTCYLLSVGIVAAYIALLPQLRSAGLLQYFPVILVAGACIIWALSPLPDPNKPISKADSRRYRRITRWTLVVELVVSLCIFYSGLAGESLLLFLLLGYIQLPCLLVISKLTHRIGAAAKKNSINKAEVDDEELEVSADAP